LKNYGEYLHEAKQATVERLTGRDLEEAARDAKETAAGPDQWAPADFKLLSPKAFEALATMLNLIEDGAEWPEQLKTARAVFLPKDEDCLLY
jgi:hypothetical protein